MQGKDLLAAQEEDLLVQEEDLLLVQEEHLLVQEEDRGIFAVANAAATTRLSVGNEQAFRKFTSEK